MASFRHTSSTTATSSTASTTGIDANTIAGNFTTFLSLLTTQLQNQDPLSPMDTNQFTQQLVEFAQVEQQLKSNDQLSTLVSLQQTAQNTAALGFVGKNVAVAGANAPLANGIGNLGAVGAEARYGHDQYREFGRPERLFHHAIAEFRRSTLYLERARPDWCTMA